MSARNKREGNMLKSGGVQTLKGACMPEAHEWMIQWLRDAHAMEEQAQTMLSGQVSRIENYPELKDRISKHLEETKGQAAD
jgi:ferritin-like metal-binding protein YciE